MAHHDWGTPMVEGQDDLLLLAGLLAEVLPSDAVVWRTPGGDTYTAADLRHHMEVGDDIGQQYASDLLRIARDFLHRRTHLSG